MSTTNTLLTPTMIANEALSILKSSMVMKDLVHTDYSKEFVKVGDTLTVRTPATLAAVDFTTTIASQNLTETPITVKLDRFKDVSVELTSKEWTLNIKDFSSQVIAPAMVALGEVIDTDIFNFLFGAANSAVLATSATPTTLADIAGLGLALDNAKAPTTDRHLVLSPTHKYRYALTSNLSNVAYAGTNDTLRESLLGKVYSMNTYMDQNATKSTATTSGTATGTMKIAATAAAETVACTEVKTAAGADGGTLEVGDGFVYKGKIYRVTSKGTASSNEIASLAIAGQAFPETITATTVPIVRNTASVAFHRNAVAFVNRQLDEPMGAARVGVASADGLSVRVVYGYNQSTKTDTISFDILYGLATLRSTLAVRLVDTF